MIDAEKEKIISIAVKTLHRARARYKTFLREIGLPHKEVSGMILDV